jgi:chemotaxis protein CheZ
MGAAELAGAEDLEDLFDQVARESQAARDAQPPAAMIPAEPTAVEDSAAEAQPGDIFHRVGLLTRTLHDALRELGYDRNLESAVQNLPDARDRLNYIATLTGKAAERALSAVECGQEIQGGLAQASAGLSAQWEKLYAGELSVEQFKALAGETRKFLATTPQHASETKAQFHEIMMAQDFHDLTGQVIGRVVTLAQCLEGQLVKLLIDSRPAEAGSHSGGEEWLTGPAMNVEGRTDVVANQAQVDDLLESLGF